MLLILKINTIFPINQKENLQGEQKGEEEWDGEVDDHAAVEDGREDFIAVTFKDDWKGGVSYGDTT